MPKTTPYPDTFRLSGIGGRPIATLFLGLLILWMVAEYILFGLISAQIGWFPTIVIAIFKGGAGLVLLGYVLRRMQLNLRDLSKENARISIGEPLLAILGAILICLPGFVATVFGIALFAPSIRSLVLQRFQKNRRGPDYIELSAEDYREIR